MKKYSNRSGSITAFSALVLPMLIILSLVLADIYLALASKDVARNAVLASMGCVLSNYSQYLKDDYGLYAYEISQEEAYGLVENAISKSAISNGLFKMEIKNLEVQRSLSLMDQNVALGQINNLMKDEIFRVLIDKTNDYISFLSQIRDALKLIKAKIQIDEFLGALKNAKDKMKEISKEINDSIYIDDLYEIIDYAQDLYSLYQSLLADESLWEASQVKKDLEAYVEQILLTHVQVIRNFNQELLDNFRFMLETSIEINKISDYAKELIDEMEDCPDLLKTLLNTSAEYVKRVEDAFKQAFIDQSIGVLQDNLNCIENFTQDLVKTIGEDKKIPLKTVFVSSFSKYGKIKASDDFLEDFFKEVFDKTIKDESLSLKRFIQDMLSLELESDRYIDLFITLISESKEDLDIKGLDVTKKDMKESISLMDKTIKVLEDTKENIFLNEYLLLFLSHLAKPHKDDMNKFLRYECEYVLYGRREGFDNLNLTKASITGLRFLLNTLHVYTDPVKTSKAQAISQALVGSWTFGLAQPIAQNLLLCSWAYGEASYDTNCLLKGEKTPLYKLEGDWKTDIGIGIKGANTPSWLQLDYSDYLRVFLCTLPTHLKVYRLLDIISLNAPYYMEAENLYCGIRVRAEFTYRGILGIKRNIVLEVEDGYK